MARIIYVEDDDLVGTLVQQMLTAAGHLVGVINHGTLALDTILFKKPELVILDRTLPGMQGLDILKALRSRSELYLTPIIMLTAALGEKHNDEAMSAGANAYMTKPVDAEQLIQCVNEVLQQNSFRNPQR